MNRRNLAFRTQRPNETVLLITRRHWWAWVRWLILPALGLVGVGIIAANVPTIAVALMAFAVLAFLAFALYAYLEWTNDSIIITDQRIVRITQNLLRFSQQVNDINIASIQEINAEIPPFDPLAWAFGYGYVELKTAGDAGNVALRMIPDPDGVQDLILRDIRQMASMREVQYSQGGTRDAQRWIQRGQLPEPHQPVNMPNVTSTPRLERAPFSPFVSHFTLPNGAVVFRKHWWLWLQGVFTPLLVGLVALIAFVVTLVAGAGGLSSLLTLGVFFVALVWGYWADWDWRNDYMMVTPGTLTIIHQRPFWLQNEREQVLMKQIDNIVSEESGFWNRIWGKGDVRISLIGGNSYKEFRHVRDPQFVQGEIARLQALARGQNAPQAQARPTSNLSGAPNPHAPAPQYTPAAPQATPLRDANRPPIVQQARPNLSQGRPYTPAQQPSHPFGAPNPKPNPPANSNAPAPRPPRFGGK